MSTNLVQPQLLLPGFSKGYVPDTPKTNGGQNKISREDRRFHDWYRFVLSFPPHLVREYCEDFGVKPSHTLLDPFCGTGTTLVESKLQGINSVGLEVNPFARFASSVKVDWTVNPDILESRSQEIAQSALNVLKTQRPLIDIGVVMNGRSLGIMNTRCSPKLPLRAHEPEGSCYISKGVNVLCKLRKH